MSSVESKTNQVKLYCENGQPASGDWKKPFGRLVSHALNLNERYDIFAPNKKLEGEFGYCADKPCLEKMLITIDCSSFDETKADKHLEVIESILFFIKKLYASDIILTGQVVKFFLLMWSETHVLETLGFNRLETTLQKIKTILANEIGKKHGASQGDVFLDGMEKILDRTGKTLDLIIHFSDFGYKISENIRNSNLINKLVPVNKRTVWVGFDATAEKVNDSGVGFIDAAVKERIVLLE